MKELSSYRKEFTVEKIGYVYILKLIEKRVNIDIENDENRMKEIKKNYFKIQDTEFLYGIKKEMKLKSYKKNKEMIKLKEAWLKDWGNEVYIGEIEGFREMEIIKIRNMYWEKCKDEKMFLILQEVLLSPIYYKFNNCRYYNLKENTLKKSAEILSRYLNLEEETGMSILNRTKKMIREASGKVKGKIKKNLVRPEEELKNISVEFKIDRIRNEKLLLLMVKSLNYIKYLKKVENLDKVDILKEKFWEFKKDYEREVLFEKIEWNKEKQEIINFSYNKMIEI
ncbi:hypothetical protein [uncultured Clostridium sp.]|uniref:hypothetical protein n=1 Tax=uncultured Clostridium sp. TaxID=59620 RepID=UPI002628D238|nr:hypothetical protein [uncultured Clostridium sp.]